MHASASDGHVVVDARAVENDLRSFAVLGDQRGDRFAQTGEGRNAGLAAQGGRLGFEVRHVGNTGSCLCRSRAQSFDLHRIRRDEFARCARIDRAFGVAGGSDGLPIRQSERGELLCGHHGDQRARRQTVDLMARCARFG